MTVLEAIAWCLEHNALVRFWSNETVTVRVNGTSRRRATLVQAVEAQLVPPKPRCGIEGCRLAPGHRGLHKYGPNIP